MMADADLLSKIRSEIDARLREVRPLLAEYERLLVAAAALDTVGEDRPASTPTRGRVKQAVRVKRAPTSAPAPTPTPTSTTAPEPAPAVEPEGSRPAQSLVSPKPRVARKPASRPSGSASKRAQRGAAAVAIVAALEHGSHTVAELTIVTAMSGTIIQSNLRRLQQAGTVTRTRRPGDGKAAYALTVAPV